MKKLTLIALSLVAAGAAFADDITIDNSPFVAQKTREQVRAELLQARADGSIKVWSTTYNPLAVAKSEKTRAEVKAERDANYGATYFGEDSGSFALNRTPQHRSAAPLFAYRAGRSAQ